MEERNIDDHFLLMGLADYCCDCLNFTPAATRFIKEDGSGVLNWIHCARQNICPFVQKELEEQEEWERTHRK